MHLLKKNGEKLADFGKRQNHDALCQVLHLCDATRLSPECVWTTHACDKWHVKLVYGCLSGELPKKITPKLKLPNKMAAPEMLALPTFAKR